MKLTKHEKITHIKEGRKESSKKKGCYEKEKGKKGHKDAVEVLPVR